MQKSGHWLKPVGTSKLSSSCRTIVIVVPGIDVDPIVLQRRGCIVHCFTEVVQGLTNGEAYVAWWDHRLTKTQLFSYQDQHVSAVALHHEITTLLGKLPAKLCPIVFVGHSIGGLLVKETLLSWDRSVNRNEASLCVAGVVFLGTPHTWHTHRALQFCQMASLAYLNQKLVDEEYPGHITSMCKFYEGMKLPTFTIWEGEKTKTGKLKKNLLVDQELALLGYTEENQFLMRAPHKELCQSIVTQDLKHSLRIFLSNHIQYKLDQIDSRRTSKRSTLSINSRPSLRTMLSQDSLAHVESPTELTPATALSPHTLDTEAVRLDSQASKAFSRITGVEYNIPQQSTMSIPRDDILQHFEDVLLKSDPWQDPTTQVDRVRAFALCGSSGMGKSATALQFVYKHRDRYDNIFWVTAESTPKLYAAYTQIAFKLTLIDKPKLFDRFECQKLVMNWFLRSSIGSLGAKVPWLLVLDNVQRPEDLDGFWPNHGGGDLLVTTPCSLSALNSFCGQFGTEITPFGKDVAISFLTSLTPENIRDPIKLAEATKIVEILGGSPLALLSLSTLLKQGTLEPDIIRKVSRKRGFSGSSDDRSRPDLSGEYIGQMSHLLKPLLDNLTLSQSLLDMICLLDSDGVQDWLFTSFSEFQSLPDYPRSREAYAAARQELLDRHLVTKVKINEDHGLAAPALFRKVVRQRMLPPRFQNVLEACLRMLLQMWPSMSIAERHNKGRWAKYDVLMRHIRWIQEVLPHDMELPLKLSIMFARLLNFAAWSMYERGDYEDARSFAEQAKDIGEAQEVDDAASGNSELPELLSQIYYTLGAVAQITHQKDESLNLHAKMLVLRKNLQSQNPKGDELLAHAYNEFGNDFMNDEYDIAVGFYLQSIKMYEKIKDLKVSMLALPRVNLGLAYWLQGDNQKALEVTKRALVELEQEMGGPDDKQTMKTGRLLFAMGNITLSMGFEEESFKYHQRAYIQFKETIGTGHNRTCDVLYRLADHYERRGAFEDAFVKVNDALENMWSRPIFEREKARLCFKKAKIMQKMEAYSDMKHYAPLLDIATQTYYKYRPRDKEPSELTENDFDELVMFWSR